MPEYSFDTHLDISCGLFSFIAFVVVVVGLYHLQVHFSVKVALLLVGFVLMKMAAHRQQRQEQRER